MVDVGEETTSVLLPDEERGLRPVALSKIAVEPKKTLYKNFHLPSFPCLRYYAGFSCFENPSYNRGSTIHPEFRPFASCLLDKSSNVRQELWLSLVAVFDSKAVMLVSPDSPCRPDRKISNSH